MQLGDVKLIKESHSDEEVNDFLGKGYELLKIISSKMASQDIDEIKPCYILGLRKKR